MPSPAEKPERRPRRLPRLGDETGTTLMELLVSLSAGLVVFGAIATLLVMTLRQSGRITSHVEANQRARVTMTKIVNELNSACFFPQVKPVREGSEGNKLIFWHQSGSEVAPTPIQSTIELVNGELIQKNNTKPAPGGGGNVWTFVGEGLPEPLMKGVAPLEESGSIFSYYAYEGGKISSSPLAEEKLGEKSAASVVQVDIAFRAAPEPPISEDEHSATGIRDSVLLRLTPPSYNNASPNPPCE